VDEAKQKVEFVSSKRNCMQLQKKNFIILLIGLLACAQKNPTADVPVIDTSNRELTKLNEKQVIPPKDLLTSYDSTIYGQYVPEVILSIIREKLPNWHLIAPNYWDNFWFHEYKKHNSLVSFIKGDFNCDKKDDYVLMLVDKNEEIAVWIIQTNGINYKNVLLHEFSQLEKPIEYGIEFVPKGKLDYIDLDIEEAGTIDIQCPGIQVMHFESAAVTYFWENGKYSSVQTAD